MTTRIESAPQVRGQELDAQTRCRHWHGPTDILAIRFRCCGEYYACYDCHAELAGHATEVWPRAEFTQRALLCGTCRTEMAIAEYLACNAHCPSCRAQFNPRCALHYPLYFAMEA